MQSPPINPTEPLERISSLLHLAPESLVLQPLPGDVSTRRFLRLLEKNGAPRGLIAMLYPLNSQSDIQRFITLARILADGGIPIPAIIAADPRCGLLVVEDLGDVLLEQAKNPHSLYREAVKILLNFQTRIRPPAPAVNPDFDEATFRRELLLFREAVVGKISPAQATRWDSLFSRIIAEILTQPRFFCHRDYHCRNLLWDGRKLSLIDFQDARRGPYSYDLVSLLYDPYAGLEAGHIRALLELFLRQHPSLPDDISPEKFHRDCDMMLIQRMLKAAGTYGAVFRKQANSSYLAYIEPARQAVKSVLIRYGELEEFLPLLEGWELPGSSRP